MQNKKAKSQRQDVHELRQMGVEGARGFELKVQGLGLLEAYGSGHTTNEFKCIGSRVPEVHVQTMMYIVVAGECAIYALSQAFPSTSKWVKCEG